MQANTLDLYFKSEERINELQERTRFVVYDALSEFSDNGGFDKNNLCGRENNLVVWELDKCWPELEKNFLSLVQNNLKRKNLNVKSIEFKDGFLIVNFGEEEFKRTIDEAEISYKREIIFRERVDYDFEKIQNLKRDVLKAVNAKDYNGLKGNVQGEYMEFSIENDKSILRFKTGGGLEARKPVFRFGVKIT